MTLRILVRGGGDLASGVILRLHRAGWQVLVTELEQPRAVRRMVSFAQAVYDGVVQVEEVTARRVDDFEAAQAAFQQGSVAVMIDPPAQVRSQFQPHVIVDGRMRKALPELGMEAAPLVIGLGPGFTAGENCHVVIETNRGPFLGRAIWHGPAEADTGVPERVAGYQAERVLRAPREGRLTALARIGDLLKKGVPVARVEAVEIRAPFDGALRGLVQDGLWVKLGEKIGDVDPRSDQRLCWMVSDKALSVGGGAVEAILADHALRPLCYSTDKKP